MNSVTSAQRRDPASLDDLGHAPPAGSSGPPEPTERARRAAAQERLDAHAAGVPSRPDPCATKYDPDLCGVEKVVHAVLYAREGQDADEIDRADVTQGGLNDCHLMAPLAALASTPAGRDLIRSAITENKDARGEVVSYTVTLHEPSLLRPWTLSPVKLTVDGRYDARHAVPREVDTRTTVVREVWHVVLEKAFAQLYGGYSRLNERGSSTRAMEALTGEPAIELPLGKSSSYSAEQLQRDVAAGKLVVLLSHPKMPGNAPAALVGDHAYQVVAAEQTGDRLWLTLHNPWNKGDPAKVPLDQLSRWFAALNVGRVR
jgi:hypothetical protein